MDQLVGGAVHGATDKVIGKFAKGAKGRANTVIDAASASKNTVAQQGVKKGLKKISQTGIRALQKGAEEQTKKKVMDRMHMKSKTKNIA